MANADAVAKNFLSLNLFSIIFYFLFMVNN